MAEYCITDLKASNLVSNENLLIAFKKYLVAELDYSEWEAEYTLHL